MKGDLADFDRRKNDLVHEIDLGLGLSAGPPLRLLLRPEEVAVALGVGRTRVYEMLKDGTLPSVTVGRSRRVSVAALEVFVESLNDEAIATISVTSRPQTRTVARAERELGPGLPTT